MTDEQKAALRKAAIQATPPALRYWPTAAVLRSLNLDPDASRLMSITHPSSVLALLDEVERLREALEKLARLGNGQHYGNSVGNEIARAALEQST